MEFEKAVEVFLAKWGYKPTEFGRKAIGDPNFVQNMKDGRSPSLRIVRKVEAFMAKGPEIHGALARKRKEPARVGKIQWSPAMDQVLETMIQVDASWSEISHRTGVSRLAARRRAIKLGLWEMPKAKDPVA